MKDYFYIGVAESISFGFGGGAKFLVKADDCSLRKGGIVKFAVGSAIVYAEVLHSAYLPSGGEEEAMLAEFGTIYEAEKIYRKV